MKYETQFILTDLAAAGYPVTSVSDLFGRKLNYKAAIPLLLKWLPLIEDLRLKEEVVRALSVQWAKPAAAPSLIREFETVSEVEAPGIRWAIANALSVVADDSVYDDLARLVKSPAYGSDREMLAVALGNMHDARADELLISLLDDDDVAGHALMALRKRGTTRDTARIEKFLTHPRAWVRREARRTLEALR